MKYISIILMSLFLVGNVNSGEQAFIYSYVEIGIFKHLKAPWLQIPTTWNTLDDCSTQMKEEQKDYIEEENLKAEIKLDKENNRYMEITFPDGKGFTYCYKTRLYVDEKGYGSHRKY
jgi:hypothetical protein